MLGLLTRWRQIISPAFHQNRTLSRTFDTSASTFFYRSNFSIGHPETHCTNLMANRSDSWSSSKEIGGFWRGSYRQSWRQGQLLPDSPQFDRPNGLKWRSLPRRCGEEMGMREMPGFQPYRTTGSTGNRLQLRSNGQAQPSITLQPLPLRL